MIHLQGLATNETAKSGRSLLLRERDACPRTIGFLFVSVASSPELHAAIDDRVSSMGDVHPNRARNTKDARASRPIGRGRDVMPTSRARERFANRSTSRNEGAARPLSARQRADTFLAVPQVRRWPSALDARWPVR